MGNRNYKFIARFPCQANIISSESYEKVYKKECVASLDNLKTLLPEKEDVNKNSDLLYIFYNGAVANQFNLNGDGIDGETAKNYSQYFLNKHIDKEHNRKDVVGHIIGYGFSSYDNENKILSNEDINNYSEPFNMSFCGVIYRTVDEELANLIEESNDEQNSNYHKISTSWEVGYNTFVLAKGPTKNLKDCRIISDSKEMIEYMPFCRGFGGKGKTPDGDNVFRLLTGEIYPLGFGITTNPAADVHGIAVINEDMEDDNDDEEEEVDAKNNEIEKNISHILKTNVNNLDTKSNMNFQEQIKQIVASISLEEKSKDEITASLNDMISQEIEKANKEYTSKIENEKKIKEEAEAKSKILEDNLSKLQKDFETISQELNTFKQSAAAKEVEDKFNSRMESISKEYDLNEKEQAIVAKDLAALDMSDESFASYQERVSIIFAGKSKADKEKAAKELKEKIDEMVAKKINEKIEKEKVDTEKAIEEVVASDKEKASIPNSIDNSPVSLIDRFRNAFSNNITISN